LCCTGRHGSDREAPLGVSIADLRPDLDPDGRYAAALVTLLDRVL
jgi:hypothetical protein